MEKAKIKRAPSAQDVPASGEDVSLAELAELESRNRALRNTERAIMNVLEDTLEIQEKYRYEAEELRKFRMAVDRSPIHTVITDIDGLILYANDAVESTTGFRSEEMFGETPRLWGRQMSQEFYEDLWKRIKIEKQPFYGEITNKRKDGNQYIVDAGIFPLLDEKNDVKFFVGVERDITSERRYQEELLLQAETLAKSNAEILKQKERTENVLRSLRSIGDGVFVTDRDGNIVFMNRAAERLTGSSADESEGKRYSEVFCLSFERNLTPGCVRIVEEVLEENRPKEAGSSRVILTRRDGSTVPVSYDVAPLRNSDGTVDGCIVTFEDASVVRQEEQLRDDFLSVAAHQLRTPLTGIRWALEMMIEERNLPESVAEELHKIHESSKRMSTMIDGLIDVTRIDRELYTEVPESVNPTDIVEEAVDIMRAEARNAEVNVTVRTEGTVGKMTVQRTGLFQATRNVLSNAINYSRKGGKVDVTVSRKAGWLRVSVKDGGIGIPKGEQEKIFSRFFRATNAMLKQTQGTGMDLAAVKSFLDGVGGRIWFESEEGVGTTFHIEVPDLSPPKKRKKEPVRS